MKDKIKKNKKLIIGISVIIVILIGIVYYTNNMTSGKEGEKTTNSSSKINKLYETLSNKNTFSVAVTLDKKNKTIYAKNENKAYIESLYEGKEKKIIIKEGNTYLIKDYEKEYYTYKNNETDLEKVVLQLNKIKDNEYVQGKEQIEQKNYNYEEYNVATNFAIFPVDTNLTSGEIKTRFYFSGNNLVYIKTITQEKQELVKVEISDNVDNNLFEIPSEYQQK